MPERLEARRGIAVVAVTRGGATLGAELVAALGLDTELHVAQRWMSAAGVGATPFGEPLADRLSTLFPRVEGLVLILALGATVRLIAPLLAGKRDDPAVVVVDEAGRHAISVVGGHGGGANALAERVADAIGAEPVITTASDSLGVPAIDQLGRARGWTLEAPASTVTRVSAAAVNGESVGVYRDVGQEASTTDLPPDWPRMTSLEDLAAWGGPALVVTDGLLAERWAPYRDRWVVYRPKSLVLGLGCSTGVPADEIEALARATLTEAGLAWASLAQVATIDRRLEEPGVLGFAARAGLPLGGFAAEELAAVAEMPNPSDKVARHVGTPSVCEPAAVLASEGGELVVPKRKSAQATVGIARLPAQTPDRARGSLTVVGLGPGALDLMTPRARQALRAADAIVGYRGYLEPLEPAFPGKRLHPFELGEETTRARVAVELARRGQRVALVSSGDAGIYGMAGLVLELLGDESTPTCPPSARCRRIDGTTYLPPSGWEGGRGERSASLPVEIVPGVTAANAAAALLGAPLALDFAAISLSDLLVPWETIERRLVGAAAGDFVVVLYNPASARRREQLIRAREILLEHRPRTTPVGLVREAYRPEQSVRVTQLADLGREPIDMKTVVIVANSSTHCLGGRLVSRRGYLGGRPRSAEGTPS